MNSTHHAGSSSGDLGDAVVEYLRSRGLVELARELHKAFHRQSHDQVAGQASSGAPPRDVRGIPTEKPLPSASGDAALVQPANGQPHHVPRRSTSGAALPDGGCSVVTDATSTGKPGAPSCGTNSPVPLNRKISGTVPPTELGVTLPELPLTTTLEEYEAILKKLASGVGVEIAQCGEPTPDPVGPRRVSRQRGRSLRARSRSEHHSGATNTTSKSSTRATSTAAFPRIARELAADTENNAALRYSTISCTTLDSPRPKVTEGEGFVVQTSSCLPSASPPSVCNDGSSRTGISELERRWLAVPELLKRVKQIEEEMHDFQERLPPAFERLAEAAAQANGSDSVPQEQPRQQHGSSSPPRLQIVKRRAPKLGGPENRHAHEASTVHVPLAQAVAAPAEMTSIAAVENIQSQECVGAEVMTGPINREGAGRDEAVADADLEASSHCIFHKQLSSASTGGGPKPSADSFEKATGASDTISAAEVRKSSTPIQPVLRDLLAYSQAENRSLLNGSCNSAGDSGSRDAADAAEGRGDSTSDMLLAATVTTGCDSHDAAPSHDGPVTCIVLHPFEPLLITGAADCRISFWQVGLQAEVGAKPPFTGNQEAGPCSAVTPDEISHVPLSSVHAHSGGVTCLALLLLCLDHIPRVASNAWTAAAQQLSAAASRKSDGVVEAEELTEEAIRLWKRVQSENLIAGANRRRRLSRAVDPGGLLASGGGDGLVKLFDVGEQRQVQVLHGHSSPITAVVWHQNTAAGRPRSDGAEPMYILLSASASGELRTWDVRRGVTLHVLRPHDAFQTLSGGGSHASPVTPVGPVGEIRRVRISPMRDPLYSPVDVTIASVDSAAEPPMERFQEQLGVGTCAPSTVEQLLIVISKNRGLVTLWCEVPPHRCKTPAESGQPKSFLDSWDAVAAIETKELVFDAVTSLPATDVLLLAQLQCFPTAARASPVQATGSHSLWGGPRYIFHCGTEGAVTICELAYARRVARTGSLQALAPVKVVPRGPMRHRSASDTWVSPSTSNARSPSTEARSATQRVSATARLVLAPHDGPVRALQITPCGRYLCSVGDDGFAVMSDLACYGQTLVRYLVSSMGPLLSLSVRTTNVDGDAGTLPSAFWIATGSDAGSVSLTKLHC